MHAVDVARSRTNASPRTSERYTDVFHISKQDPSRVDLIFGLAFLEHQKSKLQRDWAYFQSMQLDPSRVGLKSDSSQEAVYDTFAHAWLLVNTRSFYWDYPTAASTASKHLKSKKDSASPKQNSLPTDECMALVPFIDLFNHTFVGESVRKPHHHFAFLLSMSLIFESV